MDSTIFLKTLSENNYFIDKKLKNIALCHPFLAKISKTEPGTDMVYDDMNYYREKAKYLSKHGFFDKYQQYNHGRISAQDVEYWVANTDQILFEVTDACNLKCKYCGFGEFYDDYEPRNNIALSPLKANTILNFMKPLWKGPLAASNRKSISIGFYGGEPLLNISLIKMVVMTIKNWDNSDRFIFSMTTNAVLLIKNIEFLIENNFHLLISLDGNENNNGYRVDKQGRNSFSRVLKNVDQLVQKYPKYFEKNVNFNAVLHNKNSVSDIYDFIYKRYWKAPRIGELNDMGIRPDMRSEFNKTYRNFIESLNQSENYPEILSNIFMNLPPYKSVTRIIYFYSGYVYKTYNDLFDSKNEKIFIPTGTCFPFSKKIFVTTTGKLLPCERIGHQYTLGSVTDDKVDLEFNNIADKYNNYYDKLNSQCSICYHDSICIQCIFNLKNLEEKPVCHGYMNKDVIAGYFSDNISFLEKHPLDYYRIMEKVVME
jgi:uncharacterized protein